MHRYYNIRLLVLMLVIVTNATAGSIKNVQEGFHAVPALVLTALSPTGKSIATVENSAEADTQTLKLFIPTTGELRVLLDLSTVTEHEASIRSIAWIDDRRIAVQFFETRRGVKNLVNTRGKQFLFILELSKDGLPTKTLKVRTAGWLLDGLSKQKNVFLYATSGLYSKVYQISASSLSEHGKKPGKLTKIDGGQFTRRNEVASIEGYAIEWFLKNTEEPMVLARERSGSVSLIAISANANENRTIREWKKEELEGDNDKRLVLPVVQIENESFYGLDFNEAVRRTVYKVDFSDDSNSVVYQSEEEQIIDVLLSGQKTLIGVRSISDGQVVDRFISSDIDFTKDIIYQSSIRTRIAKSDSGESSLYYNEAYNQPGHYLFKHSNSETEILIGSTYPLLMDQLTGTQNRGTVDVEGLAIPYILNQPTLVQEKTMPLIVMPHGGPIGVYDNPYFDLTTQYLVNAGFAVLRVNFRGSGGHGEAHEAAGAMNWGDLMLKDIVAATQEVVKNPEIDEARVCVFGLSYGGYAASMLSILYPQVYKCGVTAAGLSDLGLYASNPKFGDELQDWINEQIGNPAIKYQNQKDLSPVYLVNKLERPLLVIHGMKDKVVPVEHAFRLKKMLEKHGKYFEWHIFPEGEHSYGSPESQRILFEKVVSFINSNLAT